MGNIGTLHDILGQIILSLPAHRHDIHGNDIPLSYDINPDQRPELQTGINKAIRAEQATGMLGLLQ